MVKGQRSTGAEASLRLPEWTILKMSLARLGCTLRSLSYQSVPVEGMYASITILQHG